MMERNKINFSMSASGINPKNLLTVDRPSPKQNRKKL
jgi:hypothetical protein